MSDDELIAALRFQSLGYRESANDDFEGSDKDFQIACGEIAEILDAAATRISALTAALRVVNRLTSPGARTLDEMMKDMNYACDITRSALKETAI